MTKVRISGRAARYIRSEKVYLAQFNKRAAAGVSRQLRKAAKTISDDPNVGEPLMASDVRRFVTPPYVIDYEVHRGEIVILLVRHGRQQTPDLDRNDGPDIPDAE